MKGKWRARKEKESEEQGKKRKGKESEEQGKKRRGKWRARKEK